MYHLAWLRVIKYRLSRRQPKFRYILLLIWKNAGPSSSLELSRWMHYFQDHMSWVRGWHTIWSFWWSKWSYWNWKKSNECWWVFQRRSKQSIFRSFSHWLQINNEARYSLFVYFYEKFSDSFVWVPISIFSSLLQILFTS